MAYNALGRNYRGIISSKLRQYVILGDAAAMTDGIPGNDDDRWIYTENNPSRDLTTAANLAGTARVLKGFNDTLAIRCLEIAEELFEKTNGLKLQAAVELYLATGKPEYKKFILDNQGFINRAAGFAGWYVARVAKAWEQSKDPEEKAFAQAVRSALEKYKETQAATAAETPYGVPYRPSIWGAGWDIQRFGFQQYFLVDAYPDIFDKEPVYDALHFVLGRHPGVGAVSATTAYGTTRADWSYVPGGVISGTAIIRPDLPELLEFPYLWQQTEYVLGGGSSHYMFLVLASRKLLGL